MTSKTFEVRDRATFIAVVALRLDPADERDRYILARGGYGRTAEQQREYVIMMRLDTFAAQYDPFQWSNQRTLGEAHRHILGHFEELKNGSVIDVEYVLGESSKPKTSESEIDGALV